MGVSSWENYHHLLVNWMHSKNLICKGVTPWNNYLRVLTNWMHNRKLDLNGCQSWKNYHHLLVNWMHSKNLICKGVTTWNNYLHVLTNWMHNRKLDLSKGVWMNQVGTCPKSLDSFMLTQKRQTFMSQPHFGWNGRMKLPLPKLGIWSLPRLPNV